MLKSRILFAMLILLLGTLVSMAACGDDDDDDSDDDDNGDDDDGSDPQTCNELMNVLLEAFDCFIAVFSVSAPEDIEEALGICDEEMVADIEALGGCLADFGEHMDDEEGDACIIDICGQSSFDCVDPCFVDLSSEQLVTEVKECIAACAE